MIISLSASIVSRNCREMQGSELPPTPTEADIRIGMHETRAARSPQTGSVTLVAR